MKILLVALNSQFVHMSLSIRTLYHAVHSSIDSEMRMMEYTINQEEDFILRDLAGEKPDLVCFSCYIWNIEAVKRLTRNLKKIDPSMSVLLGGPEVSYDEKNLRLEIPEADYVLSGEGEEIFTAFLRDFEKGKRGRMPGGMTGDGAGKDSIAFVEDLDALPFPYTDEELQAASDRILYYESSRGCPYRCSYCLSSTIKTTRFKSVQRTKDELNRFLSFGVRQVKFVDRTFNADRKRAVEIMSHLIEKDNGVTNFHFEINGDRVDDAFVNAVSKSRKGLFQFEIGVQSTSEETLEAVNRSGDFEKLADGAKRLIETGRSHVHLDLIAGLPLEDYARFGESFNAVHDLQAHHLQLGFLKLLPGTSIRREALAYGYAFKSEPPYEVLKNSVMSYDDLSRLKRIEEVLERYGNSGGFVRTMDHLKSFFEGDAFALHESLAENLEGRGFFRRAHDKRKLYAYLLDYHKTLRNEKDEGLFLDLLKFDYLSQKPQPLLPFFVSEEPPGYRERCHLFLQDEGVIKRLLPAYEGMAAKRIIQKVHFEPFEYDVDAKVRKKTQILFDYGAEKGIRGEAPYHHILLP